MTRRPIEPGPPEDLPLSPAELWRLAIVGAAAVLVPVAGLAGAWLAWSLS